MWQFSLLKDNGDVVGVIYVDTDKERVDTH